MFNLTPSAANEIRAAASRSDAAGLALRVAARQAADGSLEYGMGFDEQREDDEPTEFDGLTVLVGSPSRPLLADTVLDYVEIEPGRFDFVFIAADGVAPPDGESAGPEKGARGCGGGSCGNCGA